MKKLDAFVLMPFAEEFEDVYQYLISEGLANAGYTVKRADDIKSQNNIIGDIVKGIITSDLIVADLTGANPNVYYELGIAHALNKKVILITQEIDDLPFDLRSYRVVGYSVHFAKMNQAKKELSGLATDAFNGTLPFGNPVKDFGNINRQSKELSIISNDFENEWPAGEMGLLDYRVKFEDGFEELANIVTEVGSKLAHEVTPEITKTGEKLNSGKYTTKQQRNAMRDLSTHLQKYSAFVKPNNERYRSLLKDVESSLEYILGGKVKVEDDADAQLQEFIDVLSGVEKSAVEGRQGFVSLIETMDNLPKIEQSFDRAKVFMMSELKEFIENIDQTISVIARAGRLGKELIDKLHNSAINTGS
ncbi:MAG: hypothetical protein ACYDIB_10835 [Desulfobulbia bacterium]